MKITLMRPSPADALVGIDFKHKYSDIYEHAQKAKSAFADGTKKVAIFAENSPEWVFALYGAWMAGAAVVPIDAKSSPEEAAFIIGDSEAETLCVSRDNLQTAEDALGALEKKPKLLVLEDVSGGDTPKAESGWLIEREESDLAFIVYTSGTTGNPKGVMLTFANLYANMKAVYEAKYYYEGIRVLALLPFHHILPLMGTVVMPLSICGKLVFPKSLSPIDMAEALQKYPVDMVIAVPRFYELLYTNILAKISQSKLASALFKAAKFANSEFLSQKIFSAIHKKFGGEVKFWISGGAALDRKVWRDLSALGFGIREGYGMTECAPIITFPRIGNVKVGSPGEPLPGVEIRIIDGEIAVRGGNVTSGYYNRPQETSESIRNGWLYTGDLGYIDEDGFLFITGRRKEIIVLPNGKNINPAEIEAQIKRQSKEILEVGVLMYENVLQAIVRVPPELLERLGNEGAHDFIRNSAILPFNRSTATYKRIIRFAITLDELPRTRVGKLKRYHLASYLENISAQKPAEIAPEPSSDVYALIKGVLKSQISMPVRPDAHMEMDLGLDSLGKISMQCFVRENFGVEVSERDFEKYPTLRKFSEMVELNRDASFEPQTKNVTWSKIISAPPLPVLPKPHFFHFASISIFKFLTKLLYKVETSGLENLPETGPAIIAPNHQSYVDGLFVALTYSKTRLYSTYFFAKLRSIIKRGFIRAFALRSNVIIMDINDNVSEAIRKMAQVLREGGRVVIFPEGTRTKDGMIAEFKQSFAILAKEMNVPVVPVAIRGAYEALKPDATFPDFGAAINVKYLPPMTPNADESYEDFSARVRSEVERQWEKLPSAKKSTESRR